MAAQKMEKGWLNVHKELEELPYCEDEERHRKATICNQHENCELEGKCECCFMPVTPRDSSKYRWKENWVLEITNLHSPFLDDIEEEEEEEEDYEVIIKTNENTYELYFKEFEERIKTFEEKERGLTEKIQALPPELREKIYKEFIKNQLRQRKALGWEEVNKSILTAPFCERHERIVWVLYLKNEQGIWWAKRCKLCYRKENIGHDLPHYDVERYDECFKTFTSDKPKPQNSYFYEKYFKKFEKDQNGMAEKIKALSPEQREKIYKEFLKNQVRNREQLGWEDVNTEIRISPRCKYNKQIVRSLLVLDYYSDNYYEYRAYCSLCCKKGRKHCLSDNLNINYYIY